MRHLKTVPLSDELRRLAASPEVAAEFKQMGAELDKDPRFVREAIRRLDAVVEGHVSKHDN